MGGEQPGKVLIVTLASGALMVVGIGLAVALAGQWFGWLIVGFGVLDAATIPFVLRAVGSKRTGSGGAVRGGEPGIEDTGTAQGGNVDPTVDPSYNPYAHED